MKITNQTIKEDSYTFVEKSESALVVAHITADLGPSTTVEHDVTRSLFCDLMLSGAGNMSRSKFLDAVSGAGGSICVRTHEGRIIITIETTEDRLPKILTLAKLMLTSPTFSASEISRAKETLKKQLKVAKEQARAMALTNLVRSFYSKTDRSYQFLPEEQLLALSSIKRNQLEQLYRAFLHSSWRVTIGSNAKCAFKIKKLLGRIHTSSETQIPTSSRTSPKSGSQLLFQQITSQQNIEVAIGQRLPLALDDTDYPAVSFALAVLGRWGGFSGRLMSTVREKEGLTYGIYAKAEAMERDTFGHWRIMTFFHPKDLERGIQLVLKEINKLHRSGITKEELARFKTILETSHVLLFDSLTSLTNTVHNFHSKNLSFEEYVSIMERMKELTVKDVNTAIKKYFSPATLSYSLAGNLKPLSSELKGLRISLKL